MKQHRQQSAIQRQRAIDSSNSRHHTILTVTHDVYMQMALAQSAQARAAGEGPIGAGVVLGDRVTGGGFSQPASTDDPPAHAEIIGVRLAGKTAANYRLTN